MNDYVQRNYKCCAERKLSSECKFDTRLITYVTEVVANQDGTCNETTTESNSTIIDCSIYPPIFVKDTNVSACCYEKEYLYKEPVNCICEAIRKEKSEIMCECMRISIDKHSFKNKFYIN